MGGKQLFPVPIVVKSPRLAHQPLNDVPVLDPVLAFPAQTRHRLDALLGIPYLQMLGINPHLDLLSDQPAVHRIDVVVDPDGAARPHPDPRPLATLQAPGRQTPKHPFFLSKSTPTPRIELGKKLAQKYRVFLTS
jgi:hypothetical protein